MLSYLKVRHLALVLVAIAASFAFATASASAAPSILKHTPKYPAAGERVTLEPVGDADELTGDPPDDETEPHAPRVGRGRLVLVAGSMGPTGELLAPMGTMTFDDAKAAFAQAAREKRITPIGGYYLSRYVEDLDRLVRRATSAPWCPLTIVDTIRNQHHPAERSDRTLTVYRPSFNLARRKDQVHVVAFVWGRAGKPIRAGRCQRQDRDPRCREIKSAREGSPPGAILR